MADISLIAPQELNSVRDIDVFLADVTPEDRVVFDFSHTTFIRPVGLVSFLVTIDKLRRQSERGRIKLVLPVNQDVRDYLRQADVFEVIRELGAYRSPQPEESILKQSPIRPMVPCAYFRTESDIDELAAAMEHRFATEVLGYGSLLPTCHDIFSELAINVVSHAESNGGYVLAQQYNYRSGPVVDIAVADCGIGIRTSLSKNCNIGPIDSDCDAIKLALTEGVTSLQDSYRGYGLSHVTCNVNAAMDRHMTIRSGNGIITLRGDATLEEEVSDRFCSGTIVNVTIPCEAL